MQPGTKYYPLVKLHESFVCTSNRDPRAVPRHEHPPAPVPTATGYLYDRPVDSLPNLQLTRYAHLPSLIVWSRSLSAPAGDAGSGMHACTNAPSLSLTLMDSVKMIHHALACFNVDVPTPTTLFCTLPTLKKITRKR
jgi:hypothetical protein